MIKVLTVDEIRKLIEIKKYLLSISNSERFSNILIQEIEIWEKRIVELEKQKAE